MDSTFRLETAQPGVVRLLQLSDTHLFAQAERTLLGVNTRESFLAVLQQVADEAEPFDMVLVTGDISQDYSAASYQFFAAQIETQVLCGRWQMVLLNSEVYAAAHGWLQRSQLEYLSACAREHPELHLLCSLHHLPRLVGSAWLDTQTLHNQDEFHAVCRDLPSLRVVLSGHVHQEYDETIAGVRYLATPSTAIQFEPRSPDFMLSALPPGWRYLELREDGSIETRVCRLSHGHFEPSFSASGY